MTDDAMDNPQGAQDPEARLAAIRAEARLAAIRAGRKAPPQKDGVQRTADDRIGAMAQTMGDAASFGLSGLAEDALSAIRGAGSYGQRFQQNRDLRAENKRDLAEQPDVVIPLGSASNMIRVNPHTLAAGLGAAVNPLRFFKPLGEGASAAARFFAPVKEVGAQALAQGVGNNVGTTADPSGLKHGVRDVVKAEMVGIPIGMGSAIAPLISTLLRAGRATPLDTRAHEIDDAIQAMDEKKYGTAEGEATTTPAIEDALKKDPILRKHAEDMTGAAAYRGEQPTGAQQLMGVYRRLSSEQRAAEKALAAKQSGTNTAGYDPSLNEDVIANLKVAKQRALAAAESPSSRPIMARPESNGPAVDPMFAKNFPFATSLKRAYDKPADVQVGTEEFGPGIPSLRAAIDAKRIAEGEREAFEGSAAAAHRVATGLRTPSNRLLDKSPEAWRREIADYTTGEANRGVEGALGAIRDIPSLSLSPIKTIRSGLKAVTGASRLTPILEQLDMMAGRAPKAPAKGPTRLAAAIARLLAGEP